MLWYWQLLVWACQPLSAAQQVERLHLQTRCCESCCCSWCKWPWRGGRSGRWPLRMLIPHMMRRSRSTPQCHLSPVGGVEVHGFFLLTEQCCGKSLIHPNAVICVYVILWRGHTYWYIYHTPQASQKKQ